jgi:hypothetical protein
VFGDHCSTIRSDELAELRASSRNTLRCACDVREESNNAAVRSIRQKYTQTGRIITNIIVLV